MKTIVRRMYNHAFIKYDRIYWKVTINDICVREYLYDSKRFSHR